jgi:GNAT superfamily N-acetyltransferase
MAEIYGAIEPPPDVLRVAKFQQQVIGCYAMHSPQSPDADGKPVPFELGMVMVLDAYQRNGVGRWLVGHAIGVAESKGGRELRVPLPGPAEFFEGLGLRQVPGGFHYAMYPE